VKILKRPWIVVSIVLSAVVAIAVLYVDLNNKKIASKYIDTLSQSCKVTKSAFSEILDAVESDTLTYSEKLKETRAAEDSLITSKRILDYGISDIESSGFRFGLEFVSYSLDVSSLRNLVEDTMADAIDIAIAQGDPESLEDGSAEEGLETMQRRIDYLEQICSKS
jgi:hypothetical protein